MKKKKVLWVDDEVDLLKAHILFLRSKGYEVVPVTNGEDAIKLVCQDHFDLVLLDEIMPGKDGLKTLEELKEISPATPVVMVTKNEEESLMEEAIGMKITDYLTKPINPSQVLLVCKKILEQGRITLEQISKDYLEEFNKMSRINFSDLDYNDWIKICLKLARWEVEFDEYPDSGLKETLEDQKRTCNLEFSRFIEKNYKKWVNEHPQKRPTLSPDLIKKYVSPFLIRGEKVLFILIDCMRLDQWLTFSPELYEFFNIKTDYYYSIIPSATPFARNSIFSGLFPVDFTKNYPDIWLKNDSSESSMNRYESSMLGSLIKKNGITLKGSYKYIKIIGSEEGWTLEKKINTYLTSPLVAVVINFVDMLAHKRSEMDFLKEIVPDEAGYRSLIRTWFKNSWLYSILRNFSQYDFKIVITSDHGSIKVKHDVEVIGDRETSPNIRFKYGKNLNTHPKYALNIKKPEEYKLPSFGINTNYIIAKEDYYFVYPTNYHKYQTFYKNTFQHGGISLEEMIVPVAILEPRLK
ncbi:MAG: response regulator [Candidatus Marinimicrobia bacterium]|nr:response regulator [Candidatus Neomarinimicrobiota bacterium]